MANYKKTEATKNKILQVCRELFYEKGYVNTYYQDISEKTNLSTGVINYHFQNKSNMASIVFEEFMIHNTKFIAELLEDKYNLEILAAVQFRNFYNLIFTNQNMMRFYYEICKNRIILDSDRVKKTAENFHKQLSESYKINLSESMIKFITLSTIATDIEIFINYVNGYIDEDYNKIIDFNLSYMYELMRIDYKHVDDIIVQSKEIYSKINIHMNHYFQLELITLQDLD